MTFSVGGLSTGLDTKGIIDQLLSIDARPKVRMEWNKSLWDARKSTWTDLNTRLNSLQGFANNLMNPSSWTVFSGITSSDNTRVVGTSIGAKPAAGTYAVETTQLAATNVWDSAAPLAGSTAGVRETGIWYKNGLVAMTGADRLAQSGVNGVRDQTNTLAGLATGSTVTMSWNENASFSSATFNVTATSTFEDLRSWAQTQLPGATVAITGGKLRFTSPTGTAGEITGLSMSAKNNAGTALARFNGMFGASSAMTTAASDGGAPAADTLQITKGASTWFVNVAAGDNEAAIANKINAVNGIGVTASLNAGALRLTSNSSGVSGGFTVSSTGGLAATMGLAQTTAGQDSMFTINGTAYTRSKNTGITDVLNDVSIDLLNTTVAPVSLTVGQAAASTDDIKKKVMDLVNQYNSINDFVASKTNEQKIVNPKNLGEYLQGPLARDFNFSQVGYDLRMKINDVVAGQPSGFQSLSDIGITTGAIGSADRSGRLVVDEAKLEDAINTNRTAVKDLFSKVGAGTGISADDGVARKISELVSQLRTGGAVDSAMQGATTQAKSLQDSIQRFSERMDRRKKYYERMFSTLEGNVGRMQTQGNWLSGQLSSLSR